jgi:outer membrane protein TolC
MTDVRWSSVARLWLIASCLGSGTAFGQAARPATPLPAPTNLNPLPSLDSNPRTTRPPLPPELGGAMVRLVPVAPTLLENRLVPIDLNTALRVAGVQNPDLMLARQRVVEAVALRQLAAAQFLPTLNGGGNYDNHTGVLQQSNGNILNVNRAAIYLGSGSGAVAAGTVPIPGIVLSGNAAQVIYAFLVSRQVAREREFTTVAVRNQVFLDCTLAYSELLRAEGARAVAGQVRDEARQVAVMMNAYLAVGQGRKADADRAASELAKREADYQAADGRVLVASARLAEVMNIDPSIRLHPTDAWVVPSPIVPDPIPVRELIAIALLQRPELAANRAAIQQALLTLEGAKVLPFSPTILIGFSAGGFGGGSNLVRPVFGGFGGRTDFDAIGYWSLLNMGVGNLAQINLARARLRLNQYELIATLDRIRAEVAEAYAQTHARFAQIETTEQAIRTSLDGYREDFLRVRQRAAEAGRQVLPIELLNSLRLLARARGEYLDAIVDYNEAQFKLFVALGQPPANMLAHPVPTAGVVPPGEPVPNGPATPMPAPPLPLPNANRVGPQTPSPAMPVAAASRPGTVSPTVGR